MKKLFFTFLISGLTFTAGAQTNTPKVEFIEHPDSVTKLQALINSGKLLYLSHTSPAHDNKLPGFWKRIDTVIVNRARTRVTKFGDCPDTAMVGCKTQQQLTINTIKKKVIRFSEYGKNRSAIVSFFYGKNGDLIIYTENGNPWKFQYDEQGNLNELHYYEIENGLETHKKTVKFRVKK